MATEQQSAADAEQLTRDKSRFNDEIAIPALTSVRDYLPNIGLRGDVYGERGEMGPSLEVYRDDQLQFRCEVDLVRGQVAMVRMDPAVGDAAEPSTLENSIFVEGDPEVVSMPTIENIRKPLVDFIEQWIKGR